MLRVEFALVEKSRIFSILLQGRYELHWWRWYSPDLSFSCRDANFRFHNFKVVYDIAGGHRDRTPYVWSPNVVTCLWIAQACRFKLVACSSFYALAAVIVSRIFGVHPRVVLPKLTSVNKVFWWLFGCAGINSRYKYCSVEKVILYVTGMSYLSCDTSLSISVAQKR